MPSTFKNTSINPAYSGTDVLYTCPPGTNAVAMSAIAATTIAGQAATGRIGIQPAGSSAINWLASGINIASGGSVNLLAGKVSLAAGDKLVANNSNAAIMERVNAGDVATWASNPAVLLSNADGSILVAKTASGVQVSFYGAQTAQTVIQSDIGGGNNGVFFGGAFYLYTSTTSAQRSTDGLTWTTVTCANAPGNHLFNTFGNVVERSGALWSVNSTGTQITTSTDGLTWTNVGVAIPNGHIVRGLVWTGTHWVVSHNATTGTVYRSTNGSVWETITVGVGSVASNASGLANIGGILMCAFNTALWVSQDHGQTWVNSGQTCSSVNSYPIAIAGTFLWSVNSSNLKYATAISPYITATSLTDYGIASPLSNSGVGLCRSANKLLSNNTYDYRYDYSSGVITRRAGCTITASVVEVS